MLSSSFLPTTTYYVRKNICNTHIICHGQAFEKCMLVSRQVCSPISTPQWSSNPEDAEHACNAASNATSRNQYAKGVLRPTNPAFGIQTSRLVCGSKMSPLLLKERPGDLETRRINRRTPRWWQSSIRQSQRLERPSQSHWTSKPFSTGYRPTFPTPRVCTKPLTNGIRTCSHTG
jgi:hypothetical protein